jgi:hypothetical protein
LALNRLNSRNALLPFNSEYFVSTSAAQNIKMKIYKCVIPLILGKTIVIATGYGLDDRMVRVWVLVEARIFPSLCHPDQLWGPSSLLLNEYFEWFPWG